MSAKKSEKKLPRTTQASKAADTSGRKRSKASRKAPSPISGELLPVQQSDQDVKPPPHPLAVALNSFLSAVDDYREAAFTAIPLVAKKRRQQLKAVFSKLDKYEATEKKDGIVGYRVEGPHAASDLMGAARESERLLRSKILGAMERSFFIGLFSEYDAFIGLLMQGIYARKPELFRTIRREISLTDLFEFDSLQSVMQDMLEKEIETFRRQSYVEQFAELERKFEIRTLRAFPEWPVFVEISQRRNLMTHNDGCVSQQYLTVCEREGYRFDRRPALREKLELSPEYLSNAMYVVSKTSFMLAHTLWRKVLPDDTVAADEAFNETQYGLLTRKRWKSAAEFGLFGLQQQMCAQTREIDRCIRVINTAIALKFQGKSIEAIQLLDREDWSAAIREFHLANAILKGQYENAGKLMRNIGKSGEFLTQLSYHDWPLFNEFRDSREFKEAYEEIYGIPFLRKVSQEVKKKSEEIERNLASQPEYRS